MNKLYRIFMLVKNIVLGLWSVLIFPFRVIACVWGLLAKPYRYLWGQISKRLRVSITFKTASMYAVIFSMMLLCMSLILIGAFGYFLAFQAQASLERNARVISHEINQELTLPQESLRAYATIEEINITLFDKSGNILADIHPAEAVISKISNAKPAAVTESGLATNIWFDNQYEFLHLRFYPASGGQVHQIQLSKSVQREKLYLVVLFIALAMFSVLAIAFTSITGFWNGRKMLKPIDKMTRTARSISANDLHTRLDVVRSHDELKDLAETFNQMLDRIESSYEQQKQFVSDASHELRTPISVIQGYANLLKRWGKDDQAVLEEAVNAIASETEQMKELIDKLLFLARAGQATQAIDKTLFSMDELVAEVLYETGLVAAEHTIGSEINQAAFITADRQLIKQALRIFVDNSVKYTPAGGMIKINSRQAGKKIMLTIEDTGSGIAQEELPYIFDRFYRCDKSRTRQTGGTGLGLAIAKWIVEKHGGTIHVESALGLGTKVVVILPVD